MKMFRSYSIIIFLLISMTAQAAHEVSFVSEIAVDRPVYVATDKNGDIFVTGRKGGFLNETGLIYVYNKEGKLVQTIESTDSNGVSYLKKPAGVALYSDHMYVCDIAQDKVLVFSRDGKYVDGFGESGSLAKQFKNPEGIFVYQGIIYVADTGNGRIQVFGPNGVYLRSIGNTGLEETQLRRPTNVAVDSRGMIYAVDSSARVVKMYRQDGRFAGIIDGTTRPFALAMADDGLFITDIEKCSITKYNSAGEKLFSFGMMGKGKVQFEELHGVATDNKGQIYAVDGSRGVIQIIATGKEQPGDRPFAISPPTYVKWVKDIPIKTKKAVWDKGSKKIIVIDDESNALMVIREGAIEKSILIPDVIPVSVAVDHKGFLWVIDRKTSQLVKADLTGRVLLAVGSSGSRQGYFLRPAAVFIGKDGLVYVADTGNSRIQVFNGEGVFLNAFTKASGNQPLADPLTLAQDRQGNLYVLCEERKVVVCLAPDGSVIREIGGDLADSEKLDKPVDVAVDGTELFVLDAGTRSVKVFTLGGRYLREFGAKGNGKGDFENPSSIAVLDDARFIVSDLTGARMQLFSIQYTPVPPGGISAKPGMRVVDLAWNSPEETFVETHRVFRSREGDPGFQEIGVTQKNSYRDTTVLPDVKYLYRVSSRSRGGNENISVESAAAIPMKYTPPTPVDLKAQSQEWSVDLNWKMDKPEYIDHFRVYRDRDGEALLARPKTEVFSEGGLESDTSYTYQVSAVSVDGIESEPAIINIRTLVAARMPLEIEILQMSDIFSNTYKIYETEGIGRIRLTNHKRDPIVALKLAFHIKEFMDFPTEVEIRNLLPKESREVVVNAVFNNKVLDVTEDTPVQTELKATYFENQRTRHYTKNNTIKLYEKHRMLWVDKDRIATFVTPTDPVLLDFTRAVVTQYANVDTALIYAAAIYEYMGVLKMTYLKHPSNPYQIVDGKTSLVDYVQYPRETLKRNSGVCTDLVVLYTAALESLGISTLILGTPEHLFIMFAVGQVSELGDSTMNNMFAIHDGIIWVPVELTLVGSKFMKAWESGSKMYYEWKKKGIEITDITQAWGRYKPATLPYSDWRVPEVAKSEVNKRSGDEMIKLNRIWLKYISNHYHAASTRNPRDAHAFLQLGIIYGEAGELDKAQAFLQRAEKLQPDSSEVKNNMGNLYYLKGKYELARKSYEKASELDQADPYILINLSQCYLKMNKKEKAKQIFQKAATIDSEITKKHRTLAIELLGNM